MQYFTVTHYTPLVDGPDQSWPYSYYAVGTLVFETDSRPGGRAWEALKVMTPGEDGFTAETWPGSAIHARDGAADLAVKRGARDTDVLVVGVHNRVVPYAVVFGATEVKAMRGCECKRDSEPWGHHRWALYYESWLRGAVTSASDDDTPADIATQMLLLSLDSVGSAHRYEHGHAIGWADHGCQFARAFDAITESLVSMLAEFDPAARELYTTRMLAIGWRHGMMQRFSEHGAEWMRAWTYPATDLEATSMN